MTTYYVNSGATGANTGASKADAFNASPGALAAAFAAATTDGDLILVHKTHLEVLAATTTYTALANIAIVVIDFANDSPAEMDGDTYYIGGGVAVSFGGAFRVATSGLAVKQTGTGTIAISIGNADGSHYEMDKCKLWLNAASGSRLHLGNNAGGSNGYVKLKNPDIKFGHSGQYINSIARVEIEGGGVNASGVVPTALFGAQNGSSSADINWTGGDLSSVTTALLGSQTLRPTVLNLTGCALAVGVTRLAAQTPANLSTGEVSLFNCHDANGVILIEHHNALGSTTTSKTVYANDGKTYDGTNKWSLKVTTTAYASYYTPYVTPWIDRHNGSTSAITPYLEVMRDGSATAFQNSQIAAEVSYQGGASFASDRMAVLGTPADQSASSKTAADWTGESATAWFGKIDSGSAITPTQAGSLKMRVLAMAASETFYVDPQIRGSA